VVPPGQFTGTGTVTAGRATSAPNGSNSGLSLLDPIVFVEAVEFDTPPAGGADPETVDEWTTRAVNRFTRLTDSLVLPEHFTARALDRAGVFRATTVDNWDGAAAANGHVTVAVMGEGGVFVPAGDRAELQADLEAAALANLAVHVLDPTVTEVDVDMTVKRTAGVEPGDVEAAVTTALAAYLSTDSWPWDATVRVYELVSLVDSVEGVEYVDTVAVPAADVALAGVAPLATAGALTVTVI
jgi:uncharacterized phage protein gp47/JayE